MTSERQIRWIQMLPVQQRLVILSAFLMATSGYLLAEKIPAGGGFGWDGVAYGEIAKDFYGETCLKSIDAYRIQRIAPSFLVHYGLRMFGLSLSDANIIHGFGAINIISLTFLAWCWCRISHNLKIGSCGLWLGFCGLFFSFAATKNAAYYPVLTDIPAMALGGAMLVCYLESRPIPLLLLLGIGAFTWPTLLGQGVLLAMFPQEPRAGHQLVRAPWRLNVIVASFAAYYLVMLDVAILRIVPETVWTGVTPIRSVAWLSIAMAALFLFQVVSRLLDWNWRVGIRECFKTSFLANAVLICAVVFGVKFMQASWATRPTILAPQTYLLLIGIWTIAKPGVFLLAHILYFGPCIILAVFLWKPTSQLIIQGGPGLTLMMLFGVSLGIDSESRHVINFVPAFIAVVVKATESLRWTVRQYSLLAGLSILFSKCWLTINVRPMTGNAFKWPDQRFLMSYGPYMSDEMYLLQGIIVLIAAAAIYWVCIRPTSQQEDADSSADREKPAREMYHAMNPPIPISHESTPC